MYKGRKLTIKGSDERVNSNAGIFKKLSKNKKSKKQNKDKADTSESKHNTEQLENNKRDTFFISKPGPTNKPVHVVKGKAIVKPQEEQPGVSNRTLFYAASKRIEAVSESRSKILTHGGTNIKPFNVSRLVVHPNEEDS